MRDVKGSDGTTRYKYGHRIHFEGGRGREYIDVTYDDAEYPIDVINTYDYATGTSLQDTRADFERAVDEYLRELTQHDADAFSDNSR